MDLEPTTNILLVDDHPENLTALEAVLAELGQRIVTVTSARDALKRLLEEDFAVILLDVRMPEIDGFEAAALIRARERSKHTPIVFISAIDQSDLHIATGYSLGAVDYVLKPFDPQTLKAKVGAFVRMEQNTRRLHAEIARRKQAEEDVRQLNQELAHLNQDLERRVKERTAELETLNKRLRKMMMETHHRIRNSLQLLIAIVDMQLMEGTATISIEEVRKLETHIQSLAVVHELLTARAREDQKASFLYIVDLLQRTLTLIRQGGGKRPISFRGEEARLPVRQATSLALISNELCSNALRHGTGEIQVTFAVNGDEAELEVCDNGPGFCAPFAPTEASHAGLRLVEDLTRHDLSGEARYENREEGGARATITFPLPDLDREEDV